jgi:release factor glutamine methyltransferase
LLHGEFAHVLRHRRFDGVLANPPYVPGPELSHIRGAARSWEAAPTGRSMLDPCAGHCPTC